MQDLTVQGVQSNIVGHGVRTGRAGGDTLTALKGNQETDQIDSGHRGAGPATERTHHGGSGRAVLGRGGGA